MHEHTELIQHAIEHGRHDEAWSLAHKFQDWCIERINAQHYSVLDAGTLLSAPQAFLIKVLLLEGKCRQALVHTMYEGVLDGRNLKYYPKAIRSTFRKCGFKTTDVKAALAVYEGLKEEPLEFSHAFQIIQGAVSTWS